MSFDSSQNWVDAELRRVPLPPGLVERLRAASETTASEVDDCDIDEALAAVPIPSRLVDKLLDIVADEQLDLRLSAVAVPADLLDNLAAIPDDEALRDVPVPARLLASLRRVVPPARRWSPARLALAASLLLMLAGTYVSSVVGWMMSAYNSSQGLTATVLDFPEQPLELTSSPASAVSLAFAAEPSPPARESPPDVADPLPPTIDTRSIAEQLDEVWPPGYGMTDNVLPLRYRILGQQSGAEERIADLELLRLAEPRGIGAPVSAGFDRQFLVKHRTQPIVTLAASPELYAQRLPLWRNTGSFDALRERVAAGRLPAAHEIHVEDFLAAMHCQYAPAAAGELEIRTAAQLVSLFGDGEASLLQIGVQAGPLDRSEAVHVTLLVDTSDSMRWSDRLERVRHALRRFAPQMHAGDRLSLVVYSDLAETMVEDASLADLATIYEAIDALSPHGRSNFGAGLQQAAMAAESPVALAIGRRRIVHFTDGLPPLRAEAEIQVNRLLAELAKARVALDVIDVDPSDEPDARLAALAAARGQKLIVAADADALHRQLIERTSGAAPEIARNAAVEIKFNPKAVKAYRLLGHEAVTIGGLPAKVESSLLAGESATVLVEVWLHAEGPSDVADVEVQWTDAAGESRAAQQQVRRVQFVPSFAEAPLSLQAATIAAEAAEALRESPFSSARSRDLRAVLDAAQRVNPRLAQRPEYQRFVATLAQAQRVRRSGSAEAPK